MELGLYRAQVGKDVGVVEFRIVQHGGTRTVMHEFGAFVEKRGVVFVGFDNEKRRLAVRVLARRLRQAGGNAEIFQYAANKEARCESGIFQNPREHRRGGRFAVRPRHAEYPMMVQHVFRQPLRTGNIRQPAVQNRLNHIHPALGDIADGVNVDFKFLQLRRVEAFVYAYTQGFSWVLIGGYIFASQPLTSNPATLAMAAIPTINVPPIPIIWMCFIKVP